jgi:hypothetical protein
MSGVFGEEQKMRQARRFVKMLGAPVTIILSIFVVVSVALAAVWVDNRMGPVFHVWAPEPVNPARPWENGNPGDTSE